MLVFLRFLLSVYFVCGIAVCNEGEFGYGLIGIETPTFKIGTQSHDKTEFFNDLSQSALRLSWNYVFTCKAKIGNLCILEEPKAFSV